MSVTSRRSPSQIRTLDIVRHARTWYLVGGSLSHNQMADSMRGDVCAHGPIVIVIGRVVRVRAHGDGGWRVRLTDTGGALAAAEIRPSNLLPLPRRGTRILVRGRLRYNLDHAWYVVDPVEAWRDARGD